MARRKRQVKKTLLAGATGDADGIHERGAEWLEWMRVKHYSPASVEVHEGGMLFFAAWCDERSIRRTREVTRAILERFQRWLFYYRKKNGQPLGATSQLSRLGTVRGFFKWLTRSNHLLYNPASELELPRTHKRLPTVLSPKEVEAVLSGPDVSTALGLRDRALLEVLYSTGMRRKELAGLHVFSVDFERGAVLIRHGKGDKDRLIPIGERAVRWVEKYLNEARPELVAGADQGALFLSAYGLPFTPDELSHVVSERVKAAKLSKTGACHLFRHSMATAMLEGGADIRFIQAMLGHAKLDTTQLYTQVSIHALKQVHSATHPAATLERKGGSSPAAVAAPEELFSSLAAEAAAEEEAGSNTVEPSGARGEDRP